MAYLHLGTKEGEFTVGDVLSTGETAGLVAGLAAPHGELLVAAKFDVLEDLRFGRATGALGVQVREGVAPNTALSRSTFLLMRCDIMVVY